MYLSSWSNGINNGKGNINTVQSMHNMAAGIKFWIIEKMGPVGVILIIRCIKKISGQIKNATNRRICDSRYQGNARKKHTHTDRD